MPTDPFFSIFFVLAVIAAIILIVWCVKRKKKTEQAVAAAAGDDSEKLPSVKDFRTLNEIDDIITGRRKMPPWKRPKGYWMKNKRYLKMYDKLEKNIDRGAHDPRAVRLLFFGR